jgi:predicted nuclease with TOPRIM domain
VQHAESMLETPEEGEEGPFDGLSVEEQLVLYEDLESEFEEHKSDLQKLLAHAQQLDDGDSGSNNQTLNDLKEKWDKLSSESMKSRRDAIDFLLQRRQLNTELSALNTILKVKYCLTMHIPGF